MTKVEWIAQITSSCQSLGTYKEEFDAVISTLAEILETRDKCQEEYVKKGSKPMVMKQNVKGGKNSVRNPLLDTIMTLNTQALTYWRDLGLTPAGLKKLNDEAMRPKKRNGLADQIAQMLGE
ncbi:MAG: P27 family phage terminase small subunit [Achromobacter sp.]|nr:P27 family phage terminase small subunit [Achromobacter sp.]MBQ3612707.1 P27 family phage terminase small subunit [Bacteroidales bacterium]